VPVDEPQTLEPIQRRKVYDLVADRLLDEIVQGRLAPGQAVPTERELARSFRVGRSSVREALRVLESKGVIRGNVGTFEVAEFGNPLSDSLRLLLTLEEADVGELFEVRRVIEVEMAALAAERRTDEDLARMDEALAAMREHIDSEDAYIAADIRFHLAIVAAARNRIAHRMMQAIREILRRALGPVFHVPGSPALSTQQHREIRDAIAAKDANTARSRMHEHLVRTGGEAREAWAADRVPARNGLEG
jgi:GntR family transcriptional regulator, transcriptional repressor for pyruvate dehydrogenase complex